VIFYRESKEKKIKALPNLLDLKGYSYSPVQEFLYCIFKCYFSQNLLKIKETKEKDTLATVTFLTVNMEC
jgi:hypothetical protein